LKSAQNTDCQLPTTSTCYKTRRIYWRQFCISCPHGVRSSLIAQVCCSLQIGSIQTESYRPLPITVDIFLIYYLLLETLQRNDKQNDKPINTTLLQLIKTRQAIYVQRNTEARSCYHGCSGKAMSITYSECLCVYP